MATKKKKPPKKLLKRAPAKPKAKKKGGKTVARKRKGAPKKQGAPRRPPMHASLSHQELDEEADRDEVFEVFKSFDRDGSGSIDRNELSRLLEALGQELPEVELAVALEVIDVNHSGRISWDEFKAWWSAR